MHIFAVQVMLNDRRVTAIVISSSEKNATDLAGFQIWNKKKGSDKWKNSAKILWKKPMDMKQGECHEEVLNFFVEYQK